MPRVARVKSTESIFHIMSRSISEVNLFKCDEDRFTYMELIKKYQKIHKFNVYCYCLMSTHAHLIIEANGSDVSQFMHGINFSYASYFNKKYDRHGHLFQDRFKSNIIGNLRYLIVASAYIHNNPTSITKYAIHPERYEYSSLSVYLGLKKDRFNLINSNFVLSLFGNDYKSARKNYFEFVFKCENPASGDIEFEHEGTLYCSQKKLMARSTDYKWIIDYVSRKTNTPSIFIYTKNNRKATEARALLVLLMKCLCNFNSTKICSAIGNITQTNVSRLTNVGLSLLENNLNYRNIFEDFMQTIDV